MFKLYTLVHGSIPNSPRKCVPHLIRNTEGEMGIIVEYNCDFKHLYQALQILLLWLSQVAIGKELAKNAHNACRKCMSACGVSIEQDETYYAILTTTCH